MSNSCNSIVPIDYSPSGSSVHGIFQTRILEWVAISSSRGSSWLKDQTCISCIFFIGRWFFTNCTTWEAPIYNWLITYLKYIEYCGDSSIITLNFMLSTHTHTCACIYPTPTGMLTWGCAHTRPDLRVPWSLLHSVQLEPILINSEHSHPWSVTVKGFKHLGHEARPCEIHDSQSFSGQAKLYINLCG